MSNSFKQKQNDEQHIKLLRAALQSYSNAKKWENRFAIFLIFLAIAYPLFYVFSKDDKLKLILFGCSLGLTMVIQMLYNGLKKDTVKGALLKEEFDITVLGLPRKYTLPAINHTDVSTLSVLYRKNHEDLSKTKNWYPINLSENVPANNQIAVCQRINTGWGGELRKSYRNGMIAMLCVYSLLLFYFFYSKDATFHTVFSVLFSVQSFYTYFLTQIRGHNSVIEKRDSLSKMLDKIILNKEEISTQHLRDLQDEIYSTRLEVAKVPDFIYGKSRKDIETSFEKDYVEKVNALYET